MTCPQCAGPCMGDVCYAEQVEDNRRAQRIIDAARSRQMSGGEALDVAHRMFGEVRVEQTAQCIREAVEVADAMREHGAHAEAWGASTVANYLNKQPPFGFIGPPMPRAPDAWKDRDDKPLPEDAEIDAAFPTESGRHDTYMEAMRMVGAKYSKGGLVALVNWLLIRAEAKR